MPLFNVDKCWRAAGRLFLSLALLPSSALGVGDIAFLSGGAHETDALLTEVRQASGASDVRDVSELSQSVCEQYHSIVVTDAKDAVRVSNECPVNQVITVGVSKIDLDTHLNHLKRNILRIPYEQSAAFHLALALSVKTPIKGIAVLHGDDRESRAQLDLIKALTRIHGIQTRGVLVHPGDNPAAKLLPILPDVTAVIALADSRIINNGTIKALLLSTARRQIPVVGGPSHLYIRSGVSIGAFTNTSWIAQQIVRAARGESIHEPDPDDWEVGYNKSVATILNLNVTPPGGGNSHGY